MINSITSNGSFRRLGSYQIEKIPHVILSIENDIIDLHIIRNQKIQMQNNIILKINTAAKRIAQNSIYGSGINIKNNLNIVSIIQRDIWLLKLSRI